MVLTDMKDQFIQQIISTVEIIIHILTVFQIGNVFWYVMTIADR